MNKTSLYNLVKQKITDRVQQLESFIAEVRDSNNDTKSSMGDKYETSREMLQQEINRLQLQLKEVYLQQQMAQRLSVVSSEVADFGALVETEAGWFYLSVSVGELSLDGQKVMAISQDSPLAKAMKGKKKDEEFQINGIKRQIKNIW